MARPSKLTPEVRSRLLQAIGAGNYYESACAYAGIDYSTFRRWMQRGAAARSGEFCEFCEEVQAADAAAEVRVVSQWQAQIPDNWQAARDFLARRYPDRWANTEKVRVQVERELERALELLEAKLPSSVFEQVLAALSEDAGEA